MPWWCGCDGSGVRWRRATGRRGWRGGGGCSCTSSPIGRWRSRCRRGPSRGRRTRGECGPPGALLPGARAAGSSRKSPAPASKRLAPRGEDPLLDPGAASEIDLLEGGRTGRRESSGRGRSCTPTRSGQRTPGAGPAAPPLRSSMHWSADQRDGRSHCAAMEQADALRPIAPSRRRLLGCAGPPRWWCRAGRWRPPRTPGGSRPRRVSEPAPAPSPTRRKHPPGRSGTGQNAPAPTRSHVV